MRIGYTAYCYHKVDNQRITWMSCLSQTEMKSRTSAYIRSNVIVNSLLFSVKPSTYAYEQIQVIPVYSGNRKGV